MLSELMIACFLSLLPSTPPVCEMPTDVPATQPSGPTTKPSSIEKVDVEKFDALRAAEDAVVLDVRTPREFEAGHLPGAINLPIADKNFEANLARLDKTKTYLVHCKTGKRSDVAVHRMETLGFNHLYDLTGGIVAWNEAGKPVEK